MVFFFILLSLESLALIFNGMCCILIKRRHDLSGSFYKLFLTYYLVSIILYFAEVLCFRLPSQTSSSDFFAVIFNKVDFPALAIIRGFCAHLQLVEHLLVLTTVFHRLSAILYPNRYSRVWRKILVPVILVILVIPLRITYPLFTHRAYFVYNFRCNHYALQLFERGHVHKKVHFLAAIGFIDILSLLIVILTFIVIMKTKSQSHRLLRQNKKLFFYGSFQCSLCCLVTVFQICSELTHHTTFLHSLDSFFKFTGSYITDLLIFPSPIVLFITCQSLCRNLFKRVPKTKVTIVQPSSQP